MNDQGISKKQITALITIIFLFIGLGVGLYLFQTKQTLSSKAAADINTGLKLTDDSGQEIQYVGDNTFETTSDRINVSIKNIKALIEPESY